MGFLSTLKQWANYLVAPQGRPATQGYDPPPRWSSQATWETPIWSSSWADVMLLDHQVAFGVALGNAPLMSAQVKVTGPTDVQEFVTAQWKRIWSNHSRQIFRAKYYGWSGYEVVYRISEDRQIEFDTLLDRAPRDTFPLIHRGKRIGVRFHSLRNIDPAESSRGKIDLFGPRALWLTYDAEYGSRFGRALLERAYHPWYEKIMPGGGLALRRLRMIKDAWIGDVVKFPMGRNFTCPDGTQVPWRDVLRELIESRSSGGVLALPSDHDTDGNPLVEYQPPTNISGATQIMEWVHDLDWDIFDGLYVPREIVEAAASGSGYSGRSIPFVAYVSIRDVELKDDVRQINEQIIKPLVILNYGRKAAQSYEIEPVPLLDTVGDLMGSMGKPDTQQQARPPQYGGMMSEQQPMQFSLDDKGHDHRGKGAGGGQFTRKGTGTENGVAAAKQRPQAKQPAPKTVRVPPKPLSDKAARAKAAHHMIDREVQRYAEEHNEPAFAKVVGGVSFPDGEPIDVAVAGNDGQVAHGIELKTMVDNKANKITMKRDAMERKAKWERKNRAAVHTVVLDDSAAFNAKGPGQHDLTKRRIFYRRGYGSFRVNTMHEVKTIDELKALMGTPDNALPPAAQRPTGQRLGRLAA